MPTEPTSIPLWAALLGYLIGSIPFGLLLTRAAGMGDVRKIGSGNIGATNVLRTGNKGLAAATVLLDAAKAVIPVLVARAVWPGAEGIAAVAAVAGHCFTPWLAFKGGKGFASAAGALGCSPTQLVKFLKLEPKALAAVNQQRKDRGLHALR